MTRRTHHFKPIVASLVLAVGISLPPGADALERERLDRLYDELAQAEGDAANFIERQIWEEWAKSGSPAIDLLLNRGREALENEDWEAAVEHFTAAADHAPDVFEAYNGRATAYFHLGLYGPALDDLARVLALEPRHFGAMTGLAVILAEIGETEEALRAFREVARINPSDSEVQEQISNLELQLRGQNI